MASRFWKTLTAALLVAVQVFAGVAGGAAGWEFTSNSALGAGAPVETVLAPCEMTCCKVASCWCEVAPVRTPATPAPVAPPVPLVEFKLSAPLPAEDLISLTLALLEQERKAPVAPSTEVMVHVPEAPLFALHCSWLI